MNNAEVSAIIPLYNSKGYIAEAIESVLDQTIRPAEIIVVDDGSTDGGGEVARQYALVRYAHQTNSGIGATRNAGVRMATGKFYAFLDADDRWEPRRLEVQLAAFAADPALDMTFGLVQEFWSPELARPDEVVRPACSWPVPGPIPSAMLIRANAFHRVGWFETGWKQGEFASWYVRSLELGLNQTILAELVAWRRLHRDNNGVRNQAEIGDYARILKASLDRRRAAGNAASDA